MMSLSTRINPAGIRPTSSNIHSPGHHIDKYYHQNHHQSFSQNHIHHNPTHSYLLGLHLNQSLSEHATLTTELLSFSPPYSYANHPPVSPVSDVSHHSSHHARLPVTTNCLSDSSNSVASLSPCSSHFSSDQGTRFSSLSPLIPQAPFELSYQSSSPVAMTHEQKQNSLLQLDPNWNRGHQTDYKQPSHQNILPEQTSLKPTKAAYSESDSFESLTLSRQSKSGGENQSMQWQKSPNDEKLSIVNEEVHAKIQTPTNLVYARDHSEIIGHSRTVCGRKYREYPCQFCNKLFARPSTLLQHNRVHTGERPYKCEVENCKQTFNILSNARRHTKRHLSSIESCGSFDQE